MIKTPYIAITIFALCWTTVAPPLPFSEPSIYFSVGPHLLKWRKLSMGGHTQPLGIGDSFTKEGILELHLRILSNYDVDFRLDKINKATGATDWQPITGSNFTKAIPLNDYHYLFNRTISFDIDLESDALLQYRQKLPETSLGWTAMSCKTSFSQENDEVTELPSWQGYAICRIIDENELKTILAENNISDTTLSPENDRVNDFEIGYDSSEPGIVHFWTTNLSPALADASVVPSNINNLAQHFPKIGMRHLKPMDLSRVDQHSDRYYSLPLTETGGSCGAQLFNVINSPQTPKQLLIVCFNEKEEPVFNPTFELLTDYVSIKGKQQSATTVTLHVCFNNLLFPDYANFGLICDSGVAELLDFDQSRSKYAPYSTCIKIEAHFEVIKLAGNILCQISMLPATGDYVEKFVDLPVKPPPQIIVVGTPPDGDGKYKIKLNGNRNSNILVNLTTFGKVDTLVLTCEPFNQTAVELIPLADKNFVIQETANDDEVMFPETCQLIANGTGFIVKKHLIFTPGNVATPSTGNEIYILLLVVGVGLVLFVLAYVYESFIKKQNNGPPYTRTEAAPAH